MEAADSADCKNLAFVEELCGLFYRVAGNFVSVSVQEEEFRTALIAGDCLGMVAPVFRVGIVGFAGGTFGKLLHGSPLAVVGDSMNHAVSRAAVGARGCPISIVAAFGI